MRDSCLSARNIAWNDQDADNGLLLRSRIVQTLNVPQRVRFGPSLAAALPKGLFDHPKE
jgi:hypothetical protein